MKPKKTTLKKLITDEKQAAKEYRKYGFYDIAKQEHSHMIKLKKILRNK